MSIKTCAVVVTDEGLLALHDSLTVDEKAIIVTSISEYYKTGCIDLISPGTELVMLALSQHIDNALVQKRSTISDVYSAEIRIEGGLLVVKLHYKEET